MRFTVLCVLWISLSVPLLAESAHADVGQCWVMFVYQSQMRLDDKQQQEIGERLTTAHMNSRGSDRHVLLICYLDSDEPGDLYRISPTKSQFGTTLEGYRITAKDFEAMRLAVAALEKDFKVNGGPKPRFRKIASDTPRDSKKTQ